MPSINTSTLFASPASADNAKDLNVIGYTDAAEAAIAGVEHIITSSFNNARSKNDAIVVSSRKTFGTRTFEPGLYYWPIDGQSNIETLILATPSSPEFGAMFETTVDLPTDTAIEILPARRSYLSRGGMVPMSVNMNAVGAKMEFDTGQAGLFLAELLIAKTSTVGKLKVTMADDTGTEGGFVIIDLAAATGTVTALATFPPLFLAGGQFRADGATYNIADLGDEYSTNLFFRPADEANTKLRLTVELEETPGKLEFMVASDQLAGKQTQVPAVLKDAMVEFSGSLGPGNGGSINLPLTDDGLTLRHIVSLTLSNGSTFSPPLNTGENDNRWWYDFNSVSGVVSFSRFGAFTGGAYRGVALYST